MAANSVPSHVPQYRNIHEPAETLHRHVVPLRRRIAYRGDAVRAHSRLRVAEESVAGICLVLLSPGTCLRVQPATSAGACDVRGAAVMDRRRDGGCSRSHRSVCRSTADLQA